VLVDPINPTLKAPGIKRLKLKHDEALSSFAFKNSLRRYNSGHAGRGAGVEAKGSRQGLTLAHF
jgi:hypothetical protein